MTYARHLLLAASLAAMATPAMAHRGHSSLSVVEIAGDGAVTVTHRMAAHDAEPALRSLAPDLQPNLDDPEALAALVSHVGQAFALSTAEGDPIALRFVASDLAGDDVQLIFAGAMPGTGAGVVVDSAIFEDALPRQENQVNVRRAGVTRTVVFHAGDGPQKVTP